MYLPRYVRSTDWRPDDWHGGRRDASLSYVSNVPGSIMITLVVRPVRTLHTSTTNNNSQQQRRHITLHLDFSLNLFVINKKRILMVS